MITTKTQLVQIINENLHLEVKEIDLVKLEKLDLDFVPDLYTHSWAGKFGDQAFLVGEERWDCLDAEGSHSENGRITAEYSAEPIGVQLSRRGARAGNVVFFYAHHNFNNDYRKSKFGYFVLTEAEIQQIASQLEKTQAELL